MNVRDLHEKLRSGFACIDGVPRNYMEIRCPMDRGEIFIARFIYQSIGVTMRGEPEQVEPVLCAWMWQRLASAFPKEVIEDRDTLVIFRRWPSIAGYIDAEGYECTKLTMRLVIPGEELKRIFGEATIEEGQLLHRL